MSVFNSVWNAIVDRKTLAVISLTALLAIALVPSGSSLLSVLQADAQVPSGHVESYSFSTTSPYDSQLNMDLTHSTGGDLLTVTYYPTVDTSVCDEVEVSMNGTLLSPVYTVGSYFCQSSQMNIGESLYVAEQNITFETLSGDVGVNSTGGPNSYTYWTVNGSGTAEVKLTANYAADTDGDGVADESDNCEFDANTDQADVDGDGLGDACDFDPDNDGLDNDVDNCPNNYNPDQTDNDGDGVGYECDDIDEVPNTCDWTDDHGNCMYWESWSDYNGEWCTWHSEGDIECQDVCDWWDDSGSCMSYGTWSWAGGEWCTYHAEGDWECESSTDGGNNSSGYVCETYDDGDYSCTECYEDGALTNESCWLNSTTGDTTSSCEYFTDDETGLSCMSCYSDDGTEVSENCSIEAANYNNYEDGTVCEYEYEWDDQFDYWQYTCEVCSFNGTVVSESCMDDNYSSTCDWTDDYGNCMGYGSWSDFNGDWCTWNSDGSLECSNDYTAADDDDDDDDDQCDWTDDHGSCQLWGNWSDYNSEWCALYSDGYIECEGDDDQCDWTDDYGSCQMWGNWSDYNGEWCALYSGGYIECEGDNDGSECDWTDDHGNCMGFGDWSDSGGEWCTHYDNGEFECEYVNSGGGDAVPEEDLEQQLRDMTDGLRWKDHDLKEFDRFEKRIERKIKDFENRMENIEDQKEWMEEDGIDTDEMDDVIEAIEDMIERLETLAETVEDDYEDFADELEDQEQLIESLSRSDEVSWDELDAVWTLLRRTDKYQLLRDMYDGQLQFYDMQDGILEWQREKGRLLAEMDHMGIDLSDEDEDNIEQAYEWIEEFYELHDELIDAVEAAKDVLDEMPSETEIDELLDWETRDDFRYYFDSDFRWAWDDVIWARDGLGAHGWDNWLLWEFLENLYNAFDSFWSSQWIQEELMWVNEELDVLEEATDVLEGLLSSRGQANLDDIQEAIPKVQEIVDDMEDFVDENQDNMESLERAMEDMWYSLDRAADYIDPKIGVLIDEVLSIGLETLLSDEDDLKAVQELIYRHHYGYNGDDDYYYDKDFHYDDYAGGPQYGDPCGQRCGHFEDAYGMDVTEQIKQYITADIEKIVDDIVQNVTSVVMEQVIQYVDDEVAGKILQDIMKNFDHLGNHGEEILEHKTAVLEGTSQIDFDGNNEFRDEMKKLKALRDDFARLPILEADIASEVKQTWSDCETVLSNPTEDDLVNCIDDLTVLRDQIIEAQYDNRLALNDVLYIFDEDYDEAVHWYGAPVFNLYQNGDVDGYKNADGTPSYEFGPGNPLLIAEVEKVALKVVLDLDLTEGGDPWYQVYHDKIQDLELSIGNEDPTRQVTRGEMMQLMYELLLKEGIVDAPTEFRGYLDVGNSHPYWKAFQVLYENEIIQGQGGTTADMDGNLNRAEMAIIVTTIQELVQSVKALNDADSSFRVISEKKSVFTQLGQFMKVMLPMWMK
jgi:hypothetical protein